MNTSGTLEIMVLCLERPLVSKNHLLRTHAYPDRWLAMRTVGTGAGHRAHRNRIIAHS
jgi:hypothetical protein